MNAEPKPVRLRRAQEIFVLQCHGCERDISVPVCSVCNGIGTCPSCKTRLEIRWSEAVAS